MRYLILALSVVILSGYANATTLTLVTLDHPPVEFEKDGKGVGRNVDIAVECLRRMGFKSQVRIIPWKRALIMVETGVADAIIDAAYTPERADFLLYPDEPIYIEEWYAFKQKGKPVSFDRDLGNLKEYVLGISRGFEYGGLIQEAINNKRFKKIQEVVNNEMNIKKLVKDRFDVFIGVKVTVFYQLKQLGYAGAVDLVPMTETGKPYLLSASKTYVAFSKKTMTPEIARLFSHTLKIMKTDGSVEQINRQYY